MSRGHVLSRALTRAFPRAAGYLYTQKFTDTRELGSYPDDVCPLGARRVDLAEIPRVRAAYVWGDDEPTVLAMHGWGADTTAMVAVVEAALDSGEGAVCFDAPGHGVSPGSHATITEYASATLAVLQRFQTVRTVVAHSLAGIAAVAAIAALGGTNVRDVLLLAPACSLSRVLDRWVAAGELPGDLVELISLELQHRDRFPVSYWDIRTLRMAPAVRVQILHDPADDSVPFGDSQLIAAAIGADLQKVTGTGHFGIVGSDVTRARLTSCLRRDEMID
jgi:pimeloyl-ACP methyl ester carboxylesterase